VEQPSLQTHSSRLEKKAFFSSVEELCEKKHRVGLYLCFGRGEFLELSSLASEVRGAELRKVKQWFMCIACIMCTYVNTKNYKLLAKLIEIRLGITKTGIILDCVNRSSARRRIGN
jgi:hypothetical protein